MFPGRMPHPKSMIIIILFVQSEVMGYVLVSVNTPTVDSEFSDGNGHIVFIFELVYF